jgi:hypothetical protein
MDSASRASWNGIGIAMILFAEVGFFKDEEKHAFDDGIKFRVGGVIDAVATAKDKRPQASDGKIHGLHVCDIGIGALLLLTTFFNSQKNVRGKIAGNMSLTIVSSNGSTLVGFPINGERDRKNIEYKINRKRQIHYESAFVFKSHVSKILFLHPS